MLQLTWSLKDLVQYDNTKMEMDWSIVITLNEEVFGKKRQYVFQEYIHNFYRMKMIGKTQIMIYMKLAIFYIDFISSATTLLFKHLLTKFN